MHDSLELELALHRRQKARIAAALEATSPSFRAYEARYRRRTRTYEAVLTRAEAVREALAGDVVYVGDYHTLRTAQDTYRALAEAAIGSGRRVILALELVEGRHQAALEAYVRGACSERELLSRLGHAETGFSFWPGFRPVLELARARRLEAIGIDRRASGPRALWVRDRYAAGRIARAAAAPDRPLVLALVGQYHVAPCHLPAQVEAALGGERREHVVLYQNCEGAYWRLRREGRAGVEAVRLRRGELCLFNAAPALCQQSFLDQVEAEPGDAPIPPGEVATAFRRFATLIGRQLGISVEAALEGVEVCSVADVNALERLRARARLCEEELRGFRRRVLEGESCYVPKARFAYLASLSMNHAAEEAAHFVRHCAAGAAVERRRAPRDEFYARCLEEALGFAGSRMVNPARRSLTVADYARAFRTGKGRARKVAAHVLSHGAAEAERGAMAPPLPLGDAELFDAVSHALGYLLGDALGRAIAVGRLGGRELRALFEDPLENPEATYYRLVRGVPARQPRPIGKSVPLWYADAPCG